MTSEAPKLLPCPFCGSDPAEPWFDEYAEWGEVYCAKCSASTQGSHQGWMADDDDRVKSILEAIAAWNTRDITHAQAMVAAAYEDAAGYIEALQPPGGKWQHPNPYAIRARTQDDAQAALDALLQAERVKALREAAEAVGLIGDSAVTEALGQRLCCDGYHCGCKGSLVEERITYEILALIEKETGHE